MNTLSSSRAFISITAVFFLLSIGGCSVPQQTIPPYHDRAPAVSRPVPVKPEPSMADVPPERQQAPPVPWQTDQPETGKEEDRARDLLLPALTLVADRIAAYEQKVSSWNELASEMETIDDEELRQEFQECGLRVQQILTAYNRLHEELISEGAGQVPGAETMNTMHSVQGEDIAFLETRCKQIIEGDNGRENILAGTRTRLLQEREEDIAASISAGDYQQTVQLVEEVPQGEREQLSYSAVTAYGQALLKTGREGEALDVLQHLLTRMRGSSHMEQEFSLMQFIADILFSQEQYDTAFDRYRDIINRYAGLGDNIEWARKQQSVISVLDRQNPEVRKYAALMHEYLTYMPERDGYSVVMQAEQFIELFPDSMVLPTVNRILFESRDRAETWYAALIQKVEILQGEKEYQQALQLIDTAPLRDLPQDKREYLRDISDDLISAQFQQDEMQRLAQETAMQEQWEKGQHYLQAREYDQAMEVFTALLETPFREKARRGIEETVELAAREKRRQAAELFVRAGNTADRDVKIELLFESRQLLQEILSKFPQPDLVEKVRNNLARIDEELNGIDPALLSSPGAGDSSMEIVPETPTGEEQGIQPADQLTIRETGPTDAPILHRRSHE